MKALTLWPEWAAAVLFLGKRVENRTWRPPASLVGQRLALHAGANIGGRPGRVAGEEGRRAVAATAFAADATWDRFDPLVMPTTSAIVGTFVLGEPVRPTGRPWEHPDPDGWVWPLLDWRPLATPMPCRGAQGLWTLPDDVAALVAAQVAP